MAVGIGALGLGLGPGKNTSKKVLETSTEDQSSYWAQPTFYEKCSPLTR